MSSTQAAWQLRAQRKRDELADSIPKEWRLGHQVVEQARQTRCIAGPFIDSLLDPITLEITSLETWQIVDALAARKYTAEAVAVAFCKRTAYAEQLLGSCLHAIFFDQAIHRARELDAHMQRTGQPIGPLHGLPITLKDQFHVKGVNTCIGYVGWLDTFQGQAGTDGAAPYNSQLVDELVDLGAVLYCKTSTPQTLLLPLVTNNIVGTLQSPFNREVVAGGSSGGEGALMAMGASKIGVGTDIGGSARNPADNCGVYGIKPSTGRTSYRNAASTDIWQTELSSSVGYMSTSADSLRMTLKAILSTEPWLRDPDVHPIAWRSEQEDLTGPRCFGLVMHDNTCVPQPPITRALERVVKAVEAAGHKVIKFEMPDIDLTIHRKLTYADGGADLWSHEADFPDNKPFKPLDYLEFEDLCRQRNEVRVAYLQAINATKDRTGTGRPIDAIICPGQCVAAQRRHGFYYYCYYGRANVLDVTAAVLPVTKADKTVDRYEQDYKPISDSDKKCFDEYDAERADGVPVGVQILGRQLDEERVLAVVRLISGLLGKRA